MTPAPQIAEVRECGDAGALFTRLRAWAEDQPALALACVGLLKTEEQRDFIARRAFASAMLREPQTALRLLPALSGKPWIADAGFHPSLRLAREANSKVLLIAAVRRNPSIAVREVASYIDLPFGQDAFDEAAAVVPDEAAGLASAPSNTGVQVLRALSSSPIPAIRGIVAIVKHPSLTPMERERVPVFFRQIADGALTITSAARLSTDDRFFPAVAKLRLQSNGTSAALYDSVLERTAQALFRTYREHAPSLQRLSAGEVYLMLAYGRNEEDAELFDIVFEKVLLPNMRREKLGPAATVRMRAFLATAAIHGKLDAFCAAIGDPDLIVRTVRGIDSIESAVEAAEMIDVVSSPELWKRLRIEIESSPDNPLYGLLAVRLARRMNSTDWALANRYGRFYREAARLNVSTMFDSHGLCVQRHFFYNDEDGIDSFASFLKEYTNDPAWKVENHGAYVYLVGEGTAGRCIEIYANYPKQDGQADISKALADRGVEPSVFVHRGHSFHVEKSLRYLTGASKLVYLGSCQGTAVTANAIARAGDAQVIATRGVGTLGVNDPVLKALNTELLKTPSAIEWAPFWRTLEARFSGSATFRDYIPPNRNSTAAMLGAYYGYLTSNDGE